MTHHTQDGLALTQVLRVRLVVHYGGEDVPKLRQRLLEHWPTSTFRVVELHDESRLPRVVSWEVPFAGGYGAESTRLWSEFRRLLSTTWSQAQAEEALCYANYTILVDEQPIGLLERRTDAGGVRDYLDGRPINCGVGLELLLDTGTWLPGRYEMAHTKAGIIPMFHFRLWRGEGAIAIGDNTVLRWPRTSG